MHRPEELLVISRVVHYRHAARLYAFGPYSREIDVWADLFPRLVIAAPLREERPPADWLPFTRPNIEISPQRETGGDTLMSKAAQVLALPSLVCRLRKTMRGAEAIHVRCPSNLGLLGAALAPLFARHLVAKYAGQWNGYADEPLATRLQRALLRSRWWRGPVMVYGEWPRQPRHVVPFFTSVMTAEQVESAMKVAEKKAISRPLRILFSGRLVSDKRIPALLDAVKTVSGDGVPVELVIVGRGPEEANLRDHVTRLGIDDRVWFVGGLPFEDALTWYEWAHCLVLPSRSEGWPKVVAEAMCHGVVCVAVAQGQVPAMLAERGILLQNGTSEEIGDALRYVAGHPEQARALSERASRWAWKYSLEGFRDAVAELLEKTWNVPFTPVKMAERGRP